MATDPGSSLKTAKRITVGNTVRRFQDFVGSQDKFDYYSFSLRNRSSFSLDLTRLGANADVALLNRRGKALLQSRRAQKQDESIATTLDAGTYYIQVQSRDRASRFRYRLSLTTSNTNPTLAVNTLNLGQGSTITIGSEFLKALDREQLPDALVYTLTRSPQSGKLLLNGSELGVGSQFTQADIDNGRLSYINLFATSQQLTRQLTNNSTADIAVGIDGLNIVWNGTDGSDDEVFLYTSSNGATTQLTQNNLPDVAAGISGTNVVWTTLDQSNLSGIGQVFLYNNSTGVRTAIQTTVDAEVLPGVALKLDIATGVSGNNIAINSLDEIDINVLLGLDPNTLNTANPLDLARNLDFEVSLYDGTTTTQLTSNATGDLAQGISGSNVVWAGFDGNDYEIFFYNGATKKTTQLTNNTTNDVDGRISGSNITWTGFDGSDNEVFFYNGTTGVTTQLTNNATNDTVAGIADRNVVWTGFDGNDDEVFFYNGTTGMTTALTNNSTADNAAGVSGANVLWTGFDGNDNEVYLFSVAQSDGFDFTVADGLGGVTSGTLNLTIV